MNQEPGKNRRNPTSRVLVLATIGAVSGIVVGLVTLGAMALFGTDANAGVVGAVAGAAAGAAVGILATRTKQT